MRSCKYIDNDSKILSASDDKTIKIWDVETGQILHNYTECHDGIISEANVNENGRRYSKITIIIDFLSTFFKHISVSPLSKVRL